MPTLNYGPGGINYQNWLLTEGGHGMAWHEWQSFLLQKLNALTVGPSRPSFRPLVATTG